MKTEQMSILMVCKAFHGEVGWGILITIFSQSEDSIVEKAIAGIRYSEHGSMKKEK